MDGKETSEVLRQRALRPSRSRGQNFLVDGRVADRHVSYAGIEPGDSVLEVGPGLGILTERLLEETDDVTVIELDRGLADYVEERFGDDVRLIRGDALKVELPPFDRFVSNLPYSISTPMVFRLLGLEFRRAVIMVQREFAERMVAEPGDTEYSRLSVKVYRRAECEIMENVPASRFRPKPRVSSSIVRLEPRPPPFEVLDEALFDRVVDILFQTRRKKVRTSLRKAGLLPTEELPYLDERVEVLTPEEIGELVDAIVLAS